MPETDEGDQKVNTAVETMDSKWKFRPPPRGVARDALKLCQEAGSDRCRMQENCVEAHSLEELEEWVERWGEGHTTKVKAGEAEEEESYSDRILAEVLDAKGER